MSKTLTADELFYLKEQFALLEPDKNGSIKLENIRSVSISTLSSSALPRFLLKPEGLISLLFSCHVGADEIWNRCYEGVAHSGFSCLGTDTTVTLCVSLLLLCL